MKLKLTTLLLSIISINLSFSQEVGEGVIPITHNVELINKKGTFFQEKGGSSSIDSTFIYSVDTLSLPLFDDFSKNRIQQYNADFSDPGVTSTLYYKLTDLSNNPLSKDTTYTTQQTFRKTFDINTSTATITNFPGKSIKVGDLSNYPVDYQSTTVYPAYFIFDTVGVTDTPDTIWVVGPDIVQDSARVFFAHVMDPSKYWIDDDAYHNYRFAKDPWSIGVMTFDGIDSKGYPYQMGTALSGFADYLTSKPIDLSGNLPADSLYITFLYQKQGLGDAPESTDSLILEFYDVTAQEWRWQWSTNGGAVSEFKVAQVPINNMAYFTNAFQFRFKNYGGLSGALDHFHLDYVKVRTFSGYQDTLIEDFAMSYPIISLLKDYTSVPWDHYKNNPSGKMSTEVPLTVRNSYLNGGANITSAGGGKIEIKYNGALEGAVNLNGQVIANYNPPTQTIPDYQPRTTYYSKHDVSSYQFDPTKAGTQQTFDIITSVSVPVGSNYLPNDTTYSTQYFGNYYAYDDGSAELAYGPQGTQSQLAIRYTPYEADSIIGAYIHFVPTVNDVTNKLFQLTIWADNGGKPGTILYQDNPLFLRQPSYGYGMNSFVSYFTKDTVKVPVSGTFYIGWKQIDALRLGVGLDQNTDKHQNTYFSVDNGATWEQSQIKGSVMIRPIFSTALDAELGIQSTIAASTPLVIYPNPSTGKFYIQTNENQPIGDIFVYSMMGELLLTTSTNEIDLSNHPDGIYFVKTSTNLSKTYKVVKSK
ncbi:MAG: T9SS type A sorting domain-containing protein [Crocinitomicaceae bacterium]|nr:T9SS type A sorting domain-containing protein [Crocinitomicaceae bacterium]